MFNLAIGCFLLAAPQSSSWIFLPDKNLPFHCFICCQLLLSPGFSADGQGSSSLPTFWYFLWRAFTPGIYIRKKLLLF